MKILMAEVVALLGLALFITQAVALSEKLSEPNIFLPKTYDQKKAERIAQVLHNKQFKFLDGLTSYWPPHFATTLVYEGDTTALKRFLDELARVPGIKVRVTFSKDLAKEAGTGHGVGSWWVMYSHATPDVLTVRVNMAAAGIHPEQLELWAIATPDTAVKHPEPVEFGRAAGGP